MIKHCRSCKHSNVDIDKHPCKSCSNIRIVNNNWEAK